MSDRIFGHVPGTKPGDLYANRRALSAAGVHRPPQAGISGSQHIGADSIVLSGGYEDDEDHGTLILYTGHGGLDPTTREMVDDQNLTRQNLALAKNVLTGNPVRVTRGGSHNSPYSPADGYRYDGLYRVTHYWREKGRSRHYVWRYRLEAIPGESLPAHEIPELPFQTAERTDTLIQRIIRDTAVAQRVKALHDFHCQVCGERLDTPAGPYAESAHIRPLGHPHNGPDTPDNILCLCPNHHVLFDRGALGIRDDLTLIGMSGQLRTVSKHAIDPEYLRYHRVHVIDPLSIDHNGGHPNDEARTEAWETRSDSAWKPRLRKLAKLLPGFEADLAQDAETTRPPSSDPFAELHRVFDVPSVNRLIKIAYEDGWVLSNFDWPTWSRTKEAGELMNTPEGVSSASTLQLAKILTTILRAERFNDGTVLAAYESGQLTQVLLRAHELLGSGE